MTKYHHGGILWAVTKKIQLSITIDEDVLAAIDAARAGERLERSTWLNLYLAKALLPDPNDYPPGTVTADELTPPKRKRGKGR